MRWFLPTAPVSLTLVAGGLALSIAIGSQAARQAAPGLGREISGIEAALAAAGQVATTANEPADGASAMPVPVHLFDTGLYVDRALSQVRADHLAFAPQYPLWTDGARKRRWISLPPGTFIDGSQPDAWVFPVGTRVWKEFSFGGRPVETRYMELRREGEWLYATYLWNQEGSDAVLAPARGVPDAAEIADGVSHAVPGLDECHACHGGAPTQVLGFSALQLSSDRDPLAPHREDLPADAATLSTLLARGLVRGLPKELAATPPRIDAHSPLERAALGYLHGNCGSCHNSAGPLASLGMSLWHSLETGGTPPGRETTVERTSRFRLPGVPHESAVRVWPGAPERSVLSARMHSRNPLSQMPPMGSRLVDEAAVEVIDRWIENVENNQ